MMHWRKIVLGLTSVMVGMTVAGCHPVRLSQDVTYHLGDYHTRIDSVPGSHPAVLFVPVPQAREGLGTKDMLYMMQPYQIEAYARHRWAAPPASMLLPRLVSAIASKHYFRAVVSAPFAGFSSYRLSTKLLAWHEAFFYPKPRIQIALEAVLLNSKTQEVVATKTFRVSQEVSDRQVYTAVIATDAAVSKLNQRVANFVVGAVNALPGSA